MRWAAAGFALGMDWCPAGEWLGKNRSEYRLDVGVSRKWPPALSRCLSQVLPNGTQYRCALLGQARADRDIASRAKWGAASGSR